MSKAKDAAPAPADSPEPTASIKLSLTEFCARLSADVKRPELISAFEHTERRAGHLVDAPEEFRARFDSFINKPV